MAGMLDGELGMHGGHVGWGCMADMLDEDAWRAC